MQRGVLDTKGKMQLGLEKDRARNGRLEPREVFTYCHFSLLLSPYMLYSSSPILALFFLFHRLAFPLCFSGCMIIPPQFSELPESHLQAQPPVHFHIPDWTSLVSGAFGPFNYGHEVEPHSPTWLWIRVHCELCRYPQRDPFYLIFLLLLLFLTLDGLAKFMASSGFTLSAVSL